MSSVLKQLARQTLTSGGTPQQITTTHTVVQGLLITAESTNVGTAYIGDSSMTTTSGIPVIAGASVRINSPAVKNGGAGLLDLSSIYWDGTTGDKIRISYYLVVA